MWIALPNTYANRSTKTSGRSTAPNAFSGMRGMWRRLRPASSRISKTAVIASSARENRPLGDCSLRREPPGRVVASPAGQREERVVERGLGERELLDRDAGDLQRVERGAQVSRPVRGGQGQHAGANVELRLEPIEQLGGRGERVGVRERDVHAAVAH